MNADDIRVARGKDTSDQAFFLREIAAQLAELNANLLKVIDTDAWGNVALFTQSADSRTGRS